MFWNNDQYDNLSNNYNDYALEVWGDIYEDAGMNSEDASWSMINNNDYDYDY